MAGKILGEKEELLEYERTCTSPWNNVMVPEVNLLFLCLVKKNMVNISHEDIFSYVPMRGTYEIGGISYTHSRELCWDTQ